MSFTLDTPSVSTFKLEARILREERAAAGAPISQAQALEQVAHRHGYRDWNTASAALPARAAVPFAVGQRVKGFYLSQAFTGMIIGIELVHAMSRTKIVVQFDKPVDVIKFDSFSSFRSRVTATVDFNGVSPDRTSDGQPHMRLLKA